MTFEIFFFTLMSLVTYAVIVYWSISASKTCVNTLCTVPVVAAAALLTCLSLPDLYNLPDLFYAVQRSNLQFFCCFDDTQTMPKQ